MRFEVAARAVLVPQIMQYDGGHPITEVQASEIGRRRCQVTRLMDKPPRMTILALVHVMRPRTATGTQLLVGVAEAFRNYQSIGPVRCRLGYGAGCVVQRHTHCSVKLHFASAISACAWVKPRQRPLSSLAALAQQRNLDPQRYGRHG